ncbi:hypothetical protein DFP72DRAFT_1178702 [Ephemerocybe angulata]|uniref:F-box domain-containing protein n=1 Tax=Ephemerocybe angulata TaxID=980116 RepID=A0A8H6LVP8_9AGAR|nr:hypothetical protein DFP72DRAFT_1178702 [Tulosesus angulatus]
MLVTGTQATTSEMITNLEDANALITPVSLGEIPAVELDCYSAPSPVSKLPVELLSKIFYLSLQFMDANGRRKPNTFPERKRLTIAHVSHHWRETALNFPDLWAEIYIRAKTKVEFIDLALTNSKEQPLEGILHVLQEGSYSRRVKGIYVRGYPGEEDLAFWSVLQHRCGDLETLQLDGDTVRPTPRRNSGGFMLATFTKLRCVELGDWHDLPFPCIKSTFLTHLSIQPGLLPTKETMDDLLAFLRVASQLEYLHIEFGIITSALRIACKRVSAPQLFHILDPSTSRRSSGRRGGIVVRASSDDKSKLFVQVGITPPAPDRMSFPFPFSTSSDWLLSALSKVVIEHYPTLDFWHALARLPMLTELSFWARQHNDGFIQALQGNLNGASHGGASSASTETTVGPLAREFPALCMIVAKFRGTGIGWDVGRGIMTLPVKTQQEVDVTAEIGQVTAEIDQLKEELNRLSLSLNTLERQRHALSPVSNFLQNSYLKIFYLSLQFMDANGESAPERTSLNFPDLWAEIYLRENTSHQSIDMALRNSQNQPLYIEAPGPNQGSAASHIFVFRERLRSRQVKAIYLHALPLDFLMVFNFLNHTRDICKQVETFHLTLHQMLVLERELWCMITFQTFTRLRRVELNGWVNNPFPWIRCPSVTHLSIQPGLLATMESMRDLLAFFKISPQLEFLHIHFGSTSVNGERLVEDLHYHSSIYLPRLSTLRIKSKSSLPLCILLSALHIPPTIQVLDLSCSNHPPDAPRKVASALNLACSAVSAPRMLIVYVANQPNGQHSVIPPPLLVQSSQVQGDPRPQLDIQISITASASSSSAVILSIPAQQCE